MPLFLALKEGAITFELSDALKCGPSIKPLPALLSRPLCGDIASLSPLIATGAL